MTAGARALARVDSKTDWRRCFFTTGVAAAGGTGSDGAATGSEASVVERSLNLTFAALPVFIIFVLASPSSEMLASRRREGNLPWGAAATGAAMTLANSSRYFWRPVSLVSSLRVLMDDAAVMQIYLSKSLNLLEKLLEHNFAARHEVVVSIVRPKERWQRYQETKQMGRSVNI